MDGRFPTFIHCIKENLNTHHLRGICASRVVGILAGKVEPNFQMKMIKKKNTKFPFLGEISNFREVYRSQSTFNKIPIALESLRKLLSPVEGRLNINCKVWFWSTSKLRESWILLQNHYFKYFIIEKKFDFEVLQIRTSQSMFTPAPVTSNSLFILGLLPFK